MHSCQYGPIALLQISSEPGSASGARLEDEARRLAREDTYFVADMSDATLSDPSLTGNLVEAMQSAKWACVVPPRAARFRRLVEATVTGTGVKICESRVEALLLALDLVDPAPDHAEELMALADEVLDQAWQHRRWLRRALATARAMSAAIGREPLIEDVKVRIADAQECTPNQAFQRLRELSQSRNQRIAELARQLARSFGASAIRGSG